MQIKLELLNEHVYLEGHKGVFFNLSFWKYQQLYLQQQTHADNAEVEFCSIPLVLSNDELALFCQELIGKGPSQSSVWSLLLNTYFNIEMFEIVPISQLNPKDAKTTDCAVHYVETQPIQLYDLLMQRGRVDFTAVFQQVELRFSAEMTFDSVLSLYGATIGNVVPTISNFKQQYLVSGHAYFLEVEQGSIKYYEEMELIDEKLVPQLRRQLDFFDYKQLADEGQKLVQVFYQLFQSAMALSQSNPKTPHDKNRPAGVLIRLFYEPLEISLLQRVLCDNSGYRLIYQAKNREDGSPEVKMTLTLRPSLRLKMSQSFKKPIEKPAFQSAFYANFTYPEISGISRKMLCSSAEVESKASENYSLAGSFTLLDLDKMNSITVGQDFMLPCDKSDASEDFTATYDKKAKKEQKVDIYAVLPDGSSNYTYTNEINGIQKLLGYVCQPLANCAVLSEQNPFIHKLLQEYQQNMQDQQKIRLLYYQLYRIISMQAILAGKPVYLELFPCLYLDFKFPIALKPAHIELRQDDLYDVSLPSSASDAPRPGDIHAITICYLNQLQDAYFVTAYNGCVSADEKVGNLAQQKALKKLQLNKQYNLRGIQGVQQQKTYISTSKVKDDVDVDFSDFSHIIQADGMIDQLVRDLQPILRSHIATGFSSRANIINYLLTLTYDQVTEEIFNELQQQKLQLKQQREEEEKLALISMAADNASPESTKKELQDTAISKKKIFKTIKLNNELSNALLKINAQMELEKRIKTEEKLLQVVEKVEYSAEQLDMIQKISTCLYYTAVNNHSFAQFAYKYAQGLLFGLLGAEKQPSRIMMQKLSEAMPDSIYVQNLLYAYLLSAFYISQPMVINEKEDFDRVIEHLKSVIALILEVAAQQPQLLNVGTSVLIICALISESDWQVKIDKERKIDEYMEALRDDYGPDDPSEGQNEQQETAAAPAAAKLENLQIILMFKAILKKAEHFLVNYMVNFSLTSAERYRPTEHKYDILQQLSEGKYRTQDIELIFEIIGMPDCAPRSGDNNAILAVQMTTLKDDAGKRIAKNDAEEAQSKDISISVYETPDYIIGAFIYVLYKFYILSAKTISACIFEAIDELIGKYDSKFRKLVEKVYELDLTASSDALPKFVDSPKQQKQQNKSQTLSPLPQLGYGQAAKPPTLQKNTSSFISVTSVKEKNQITQQIFARMKVIRSTIKMTKFYSYQHLTAVEEHILTQTPDFSKITASYDKFTDADAFIYHVLNSSIPRYERVSASINMSALLTLAEYLVLRSETHISERIINYVIYTIQDDNSSYAQYQQMRAQFILLRILYAKHMYDDVIKHADTMKAQQGAIASKIRACPALSYYKAAALMRYVETSDVTKIYKANIMQEIFKHTYNAYIQTQKVKDFDEFFKGSTCIGEAAFYDFSFSYNMVELLLYSINVTEVIGNKQLMQDEIAYSELQSAVSVKMLPNLQTSTAFLHQNMPLRFGQFDDPVSTDGEPTLVFEDPKTSKAAKPLNVADFIQKKQSMLVTKEASPERPHFTSQDERKTQQTYLDYVRSSATLHTDENFEKDRTKMLFVIVQAVKQLLESNPGFGPSWALFALLQATLKNNTEARLSSSVATVLAPQIVDCWAIWVCCEILNYGSELESAKWLLDEFQQQIVSMGVQKSRVDFLWKFIMDMQQRNE